VVDHDSFLTQIEEILARLHSRDELAAGIYEIEPKLAAFRADRQGTTLVGVGAYEYLTRIAAVVETELASDASAYSADRWLWYLRSVPDSIFPFHDQGTLVHDRFLAETVAGLFAGPVALRRSTIPIDDESWRHVLRFCGRVLLLSDVHGAIRWSAMNVPFRITDNMLPTPEPSSETSEAVNLYESRLESEGATFARMGIMTELSAPEAGDKAAILIVFRRENPSKVMEDVELLRQTYSVAPRYSAYVRSLRDVLKFFSAAPLSGIRFDADTFFSLFAVLRIALVVGLVGGETTAKMLISGMMILRNEDLEQIARSVLEDMKNNFAGVLSSAHRPAAIDDLLLTLGPLQASVSPLVVGPVLIRLDGETLINLAAATQRLFSDAEFPPTADQNAVHEKGSFFEVELQTAINRSRFAPDDATRSLRGRTLRAEGEKITDVDALFVVKKTLILVSAKSFPFTIQHAFGDYRVVRNTITRIEEAVRDLGGKLQNIAQVKKGDNFDFTMFDAILGVVCTPHVMLVPTGELTEEVLPGLRRYVSAAELSGWLERPS